MDVSASPIRKRLLSSAVLSLVGIGLMVFGLLLFLNSLGSGGGYLAATLFILGGVLVVVAIAKAIFKAVQ
jgi:hypothetical protein